MSYLYIEKRYDMVAAMAERSGHGPVDVFQRLRVFLVDPMIERFGPGPVRLGDVAESRLINAPFACCWLESMATEPLFAIETRRGPISIHAALLVEKTPGEFDMTVLDLSENTANEAAKLPVSEQAEFFWYRMCHHVAPDSPHYETFAMALNATIFSQFRNAKFGTEKVRIKTRVGKGSARRVHVIKEVIHVARRGESHESTGQKRTIDWTHRWEVMGHWRRVAGFGHGRDGEKLKGLTWVRPHEKGPKGKILVPKVRTTGDVSSPAPFTNNRLRVIREGS